MRVVFVIVACVLMMVGAHALRPRFVTGYFIEGPGVSFGGCMNQDGNKVSCDGVDLPFLHPSVIIQ